MAAMKLLGYYFVMLRKVGVAARANVDLAAIQILEDQLGFFYFTYFDKYFTHQLSKIIRGSSNLVFVVVGIRAVLCVGYI